MFQVVLQFIVGLTALMFVAEGQNSDPKAGEAKKAVVLEGLDNILDLLPIKGALGDAIKSSLKAMAPTFLAFLVAWANKTGFFKP